MNLSDHLEATPPPRLSANDVTLRFVETRSGDSARGLVPYCHFRIVHNDADVGHINFRLGDSQHVLLAAGHIGFAIHEQFRGHGYALQACRAIAPFVRSCRASVIITADPDNAPSIRTMEKLGAEFLDEVDLTPDDPHYQRGSTRKQRYRWPP